MELSRLLQRDQPSIQQSQQSHEVLVSKHLIPPPLSLLPKNQIRRPRSLTPMIPLPNFVGIIPNFQPLNPALQSPQREKGMYYNWIGEAFDNIVYKKYEDSSYTKIDNAQQNWNIWACDVAKTLSKKSAQNCEEEENIKPYYEPKSKYDRTLVFESRFQCGNLSLVSKISENEYNLLLQNDINTNGYSQWFFFKVSNTFRNQRVKFNILNEYKQNSLYRMGMKVIIYSKKESEEKNLSWHRGGENINYYENGYSRSTLEYKPYYTLTWEYTFPYDDDEVYFAYSYPYTYTNLESYINKIQADSYLRTICQRSTLCRTIAGNNVNLLTITEDHPFEKIKKGYIIITARIHPGQSVSSYVCNGIVQFLLSTNQKAKKLRQYFVFKILPMLNPDGVIHGNYRSNISGYDLNKRWENPSKNFHPEIYFLKKLISNLLEQNEIHLYCDLHGHSMKKNAFIYGSHDQVNPRKGKEFPFLISKLFKGFSFKDCSFIDWSEQEEISSRTVLAKQLKHCDIYALQSSFCGPEHQNIHFTVRHFEELGEKFCEAILIHFSKKIKELQIQAAMRHEQYFPGGNNEDESFEAYSQRNYYNSFDEIDGTVFEARVNSENSQGSEPEKEQENLLEEKTIKKYLLLKYSRPNTSLKRNFMLRKTFSKDHILSERKDYPSKSTSPIKKKPLYETPTLQKPIKPLIKLEKKELQKVEPKMFQPIDMIPLAYDRKKGYRSHSKIGMQHYQFSSQKLVRNQDAFSKKTTIKLVLNKNYETLITKKEEKKEDKPFAKKNQHEDSQSMFKNTWLKGFIKEDSSPVKIHRKSVGSEFIIKKSKVSYSDDKNGANLFKNVLQSLRKDKK